MKKAGRCHAKPVHHELVEGSLSLPFKSNKVLRLAQLERSEDYLPALFPSRLFYLSQLVPIQLYLTRANLQAPLQIAQPVFQIVAVIRRHRQTCIGGFKIGKIAMLDAQLGLCRR